MMIPVMIDRLIDMAQPANYRFLPVEFFTSSILKHIHVFEEGYINSNVTGLNTMICPPFFSMHAQGCDEVYASMLYLIVSQYCYFQYH